VSGDGPPRAANWGRHAGIFVTGTDTGVGKTRIATALLRALAGAGVRAVGMKPVAAGFEPPANINGDVIALRAAGNVDVPLDDCNPYAFADAVAPHLAAAGIDIAMPAIVAAAGRLRARADKLVVEGAGGALVPLDGTRDMLDIAVALELPVLLVVGMRLGCLSHALLTALALQRRGLVLAGWIANELPPGMALAQQNVEALAERLGCAPVAVVGPGERPVFGAAQLAMLGFGA
jgi:dethiobiotin synthetase